MTAGKVVVITVLASAVSIGAAIFGQRLLQDIYAPTKLGGGGNASLDTLPDFRLPDMSGRQVASNSWAGKVLILNFWATWCPPCLREIPIFIEAQKTYQDLRVVGIAIDSKEEVAQFLNDHQINYPILLGDAEAIEVSRKLGNRLEGLPFTAIFDHFGRRTYAQVGEVTRGTLEEQLKPLLSQRANAAAK